VGFCGIFEHFSRFEFFLLPSIVHARPHAGNASRWAAVAEMQKPKHLTLQKEIDSWELS
jgi:hypothetical protein